MLSATAGAGTTAVLPTVLQTTTVRGVDIAVAATIWVLVAVLGLVVGHHLGTRYASRSDPAD